MFTVTEAQLLAWLNPLLWPFIRTLALFAGMPTFSQRNVPLRLRVGLALFTSVAAQPSLPDIPPTRPKVPSKRVMSSRSPRVDRAGTMAVALAKVTYRRSAKS